jgi:glycerol-3-phosphate acyltransferase PlsY
MKPLELGLCVLGAYLIGSIPVGYLLSKKKGIDVRTVGSGNIGASNVARSVGRVLGVIVLLLDAAKGAVPIVLVSHFWPALFAEPATLPALGIAALIGHCFPIWLKFRGGKGVATALGIFLVVAPGPVALSSLIWIVSFAITKVASIGSLLACLSLPVILYFFAYPQNVIILAIGAAALVLIRHQGNIRRLLARRELKV